MSSEIVTSDEVTRLLQEAQRGDVAALEQVLPMVYGELRRLAELHMRGERSDHTLTPTAVVHEVYLRLTGGTPLQPTDRAHLIRAASQMMRRVLVDHARARQANKRDGGYRVTLDEGNAKAQTNATVDVLELDQALIELAAAEPRWARVVELRFFADLDVIQTAAALEISPATVKRDWQFAKAWLAQRLPELGYQ